MIRTSFGDAPGTEDSNLIPCPVFGVHHNPIDPGLIPLFDRSGKANLGHALETCVLLELDRRGAEVAYMHTSDGCEVDFLARHPSGREELIQVCASLDDPATREREIRALTEASPDYPKAVRTLIALDIPAALDVPSGIVLHRAADWMIEGGMTT